MRDPQCEPDNLPEGHSDFRNRWPINCARCGCVSSTVRRDHDNVARCNTCYSEEYKQH